MKRCVVVTGEVTTDQATPGSAVYRPRIVVARPAQQAMANVRLVHVDLSIDCIGGDVGRDRSSQSWGFVSVRSFWRHRGIVSFWHRENSAKLTLKYFTVLCKRIDVRYAILLGSFRHLHGWLHLIHR